MLETIKYILNIDGIKDKCGISYAYSVLHDLVIYKKIINRDYKEHKKEYLKRYL